MWLKSQIANEFRVINRKSFRKCIVFVCVIVLICYGFVDLMRNFASTSEIDLLDESGNLMPKNTRQNSRKYGNMCLKLNLDEYLNMSKLPPSEDEAMQFIPHLRNPCWYEKYDQNDLDAITANPYRYTVFGENYTKRFNSNIAEIHDIYKERLHNGTQTRLRCIPYVYIIGQPKCGTTDLFKKLSFHPQIQRGLLKETHWWRWTISGVYAALWDFYEIEFSDLADLFSFAALKIEKMTETLCISQLKHKCNEPIILDGSAFTMDSAFDNVSSSIHRGYDLDTPMSVPSHVKWTSPNAKFIVVLREPVSRLYSGYKYFTKLKLNKSPDDFHQLVVEAIDKFNKCVKIDDLIKCALQQRSETKELTIHHGMYAHYLEEWFEIIGRERFLVIRMEDYTQHMKDTLRKIYNFLDLCGITREEEDRIVSTKVFNVGKLKMAPMLEKTRILLQNFYEPFNQRLAHIMNDTRFLWT